MLAPYKYIHHINLLCSAVLISITTYWLFVCYADVIIIHDGNRECEESVRAYRRERKRGRRCKTENRMGVTYI